MSRSLVSTLQFLCTLPHHEAYHVAALVQLCFYAISKGYALPQLP
jgi:hypothetical protein